MKADTLKTYRAEAIPSLYACPGHRNDGAASGINKKDGRPFLLSHARINTGIARWLLVPLLIVMLLAGLVQTAHADAGLENITDSAGILTDAEKSELESQAESISSQYGCGIYIVTVDEYSYYGTDAYTAAYTIYHNYDLGVGTDRNGVILLLSMNDRQYATFFYGPVAENAFDAYGQEKMEDEFLPAFRENQWAEGFQDFISVCGHYLGLAAEGHPVRESKLPDFLICLGIAAAISLVVCLILRSQLKSVRPGIEARSYIVGGLHLTGQRDMYTHTTRTERKIERESHSGGGGGSSSHTGGGGSGRSGSF